MKFIVKHSQEQKSTFEAHAKQVASSLTTRKQAIAAVRKRYATADALREERRRRDEATSEAVRLIRLAEPPVERSDLLPHLREL